MISVVCNMAMTIYYQYNSFHTTLLFKCCLIFFLLSMFCLFLKIANNNLDGSRCTDAQTPFWYIDYLFNYLSLIADACMFVVPSLSRV
jgi:hypothetical protein